MKFSVQIVNIGGGAQRIPHATHIYFVESNVSKRPLVSIEAPKDGGAYPLNPGDSVIITVEPEHGH